MKKKIVSVLLTTAMVATLAAGCGSSDSGSSDSGSSDSGKEMTYWSMWNSTEPQAKVIQEAADAYEEETGIHINIEWKGRDMKTLIGTALEAGEDIDLFDDDYMRTIRNTQEYLTDLSTLEGEEEFESHVMPVILDKAKSWGDGKLYAVPYQVYTTGVWYDKAMFEEAGVTDVPTTWDEFLDVCQKVKDAGYNPITCNSDSATLIYGFQLARYIGQDAVLECFNNGA